MNCPYDYPSEVVKNHSSKGENEPFLNVHFAFLISFLQILKISPLEVKK